MRKRLTPQRQAVLDALRVSPDHPTAADLITRVQERSPGIGPATVYRALAQLVATGLALELNLGDPAGVRYDGNTNRHDHLVCARCGWVVDIVGGAPDLSSAARTGFAVTGYDLRVNGVCPACQASAEGTREARES